jgi:small subunit ribosomal protein S1
VRIKVLDIDRDRQRISLGLKQTQEDPWQRVISTHRPGDVLEGTVTKVVAFGAFVEILPGVEGLVHISELADHHVENPSEVVEPGAKLNVKILEIDEDRRRLSLSIKRVEGQNMPMQDLSAQIAAANAAADEGIATAGPVGEDDSSSSQAAGEEPPSPPPADETPQADAEAPEAPAEDAEAEPPVAESVEPEAGSEDDGEEDAGEAHEGESAAERPDSPDSADEAAGGGDSDSSEPEQG